MCYGKPDKILAYVLQADPPAQHELGHTAMDDFATSAPTQDASSATSVPKPTRGRS